MESFAELVLFLVPIYVANSIPVVLGGGTPLDFGKKFTDGRRLLGEGKTVRGFVSGVLGGTLAGGIVALMLTLVFFQTAQLQFIGAFLLSLGTMTGDAFGSFLKRRFNMKRGMPFIPDSIVFMVFALVFVFPVVNTLLYELSNLGFFFILTIILHPLTNTLANRLGLKNVPW